MSTIATEKILNKKIKHILIHISDSLIERDEALKLLLLAALSGEHILLIGPPGTAKSELARRIKLAFNNGQYFERLLTRFSVPEELFGPLSIKALENDQYTRLTKNYLPDASIAFIDEIFKANSAILNTLLTLLNEREFDNGDQRVKTPLITVVAASNELPDNEELDALYDRFLFRCEVLPVSNIGFEALLEMEETGKLIPVESISPEEIEGIKKHSESVTLSKDVIYMIKTLRQYLQEQDIYVSDRRWRNTVKMLRVSALTNNRNAVSIWDCWLMQHCLWENPKQKKLIFNWYKQHIGTSEIIDIERINKLVNVWDKTLDDEKKRKVSVYNDKGEKLYRTPKGETTTDSGQEYLVDRDGNALYLSPPDLSDNGINPMDKNADRTNNGDGLTRQELEAEFFDDYYQQRHIDGKWVTIESYINNEENRFTKRFQYNPYQESAKYSKAHINDRCNEVNNLLNDITSYRTQIENMLESASSILGNHLWIDPDFSETAKGVLQENLRSLNNVTERLKEIHNGFESLPEAA